MENQPLHVAINAQLVSFSETYRNAGVSRYTYTLLDGLSALPSQQRYTAFVNTIEANAAQHSPLAQRGNLRLIPTGAPTRSPVQRIRWEQMSLPGELKRRAVQVFHSPVNVLPERLPCASVVTVHDLAFIHYPHYLRPARRLYQRIFTARSVRRATRIIAVSESTKRDLVAHFHARPEAITVIPPVVDDDFQPCLDQQALASFRFHHQLPERYMLFLGTLEPRKNIIGLIEAYARLRALDRSTPQLVLAGAKGWYYNAIFERIKSLQLEPYITFAGYVSRKEQPLWYAASELFVYPSVYEGFGMPVAEALACGVPTITSNTSSLPEAGGPTATLVDPDDWQALAYAMQGSLADAEARSRAMYEGPRWAQRFSRLRAASACVQVYAEVAHSAHGDSKAGIR